MLFGLRRPKVLFDTNAVRDFFRDRKDQLDLAIRVRARERVADLTARNELRAMMTEPVLWELGSIIDDKAPGEGGWEVYEKTVRFYVATTSRWFTMNEYIRMTAEIRLKRSLKDGEVLKRSDPGFWLPRALDEKWIREKGAMLRKIKMEEQADEERKRLETVAELQKQSGDKWRSRLDRELSEKNWEKLIAGHVANEMRKYGREHHVDVRGQWTRPQVALTFWFAECFYFAKAKRVWIGNAAKQLTSKTSLKDMPDLVDMTQLKDASYADIVVSTDDKLLSVGRAARVPLRFMRFVDFATAITGAT